MVSLGARIREIRERKGIKQVALARTLKLPSTTLSNYEVGPNKVPAHKVPAIADALGVTICDLYGVPEGHEAHDDLTAPEREVLDNIARELVKLRQPHTPYQPTRADQDTRDMLAIWESMTPEQRRDWLAFAQKLSSEENGG